MEAAPSKSPATTWPPEIRIDDVWPASLRYTLPRRTGGTALWLGRLLAAVGLVILTLATVAILSLTHVIPWKLGGFPFSIVFVFSLFTLGGLVPLWWGLAALVGHRELEIAQGYLRTIERIGPFWRSKRWKLTKISSLDVRETVGDSDQTPPPFLKDFNALLVRLPAGKQGMLAWGYPASLLTPLAAAIVVRANAWLTREGLEPAIWLAGQAGVDAGAHAAMTGHGQTGSSADDDADDWEDADDEDIVREGPPLQPAGSTIEIERFPDGLSIKVPPAGLWKGTHGLFFFALLWNGFMTLFTSVGTLALLQGKQGDFDEPWIPVAFLSLFWLVGIGMLLGSLNMARRKAGLAVADGTLMVLQTGLFGTKQYEWPQADIASIQTGPSGMEVNDVPVLELQIRDSAGKKHGFLCGRTDAELAWLAHELRQAVGAAKSAEGQA